jgi:hypothetical protein
MVMANTAPAPESFLPLTPAVFHILLSLIDSEKHGYGIMQSVTESTDGEVNMGLGTLHGTIKRLLKAALIEECGCGRITGERLMLACTARWTWQPTWGGSLLNWATNQSLVTSSPRLLGFGGAAGEAFSFLM